MDRRGEESGEARAGLVSLGLIMELVGSVIAAYLIVQALEPALNRVFVGLWYPRWAWQSGRFVEGGTWSGAPLHVLLLVAIGILRALMHRRAGRAVLYRVGDAAAAVGVYVATALGHTALCVLAFWLYRDEQSLVWAVGASISMGWPVALLLAIRRPAIRLALRRGPAATVGSAPDQVATLMVFFGLVSSLVALFGLYASIDRHLNWPHQLSWLPVVVAALLCVRSAVHTRVGLRLAGGSQAPLDVSTYVKFGLATATLSWILLLVLLRGLQSIPWDYYPPTEHLELLRKGLVVYLLFLWPLLLHRLSRARAEVAEAPRPATQGSTGLPALGWLLLGAGAVQVGFAGLALYLGADRLNTISMSFVTVPLQEGGVSRAAWLQLLIAVPQLWVALELLRGSARRRRAATMYAACASIATVLSIRADMELLTRAIGKGLPDATALLHFLPVAFSLLVPIATLVFVQHQLRREGAPAPVDSSPGGG